MKRCSGCGTEKPLSAFPATGLRCLDCQRLNCRLWKAANREKVAAYNEAYHAAHRDELLPVMRARARSRYIEKRAELQAQVRLYKKTYPERAKASSDRARAKKPLKYRMLRAARNARRKARLAGVVLGRPSYRRIAERDGMICHLCRLPVAADQLSFDHVIPIALGGPHTEDNIRVAHLICNVKRGTRPL